MYSVIMDKRGGFVQAPRNRTTAKTWITTCLIKVNEENNLRHVSPNYLINMKREIVRKTKITIWVANSAEERTTDARANMQNS